MPRQRTEVRIAFGPTAEADFPGGRAMSCGGSASTSNCSRGGADAGVTAFEETPYEPQRFRLAG